MKSISGAKYFHRSKELGIICAALGLCIPGGVVLGGRKARIEDFESAALPHMNDLFRTAAHLVQTTEEARDLIQDVYLIAWKSFHRFQPGTNCRAWLFKIMYNEFRHYRRRWSRLKLSQQPDERPLEEIVLYEPPVREELTDEDVLAALDAISAEYREVILLADVQEFAYKEVADILNIPIGTVMSRLSRGRKLLRLKLADFADASRRNEDAK